MLEVDPVVENRHDDAALASGDHPGVERVDVLALPLPGAPAEVVEVPLRRRRLRQSPAVLGHEVGSRKQDLGQAGAVVGGVEEHLTGATAGGVVGDDLVGDVRVSPADG